MMVPEAVRRVMTRLEAIDEADRKDGTPTEKRLRAIRPEVGEFLMTLTLAIDAKLVLEVGTSAGYSALWFASALRHTGGRLVTFDVDAAKVALARQNIADAAVSDIVEVRHQDGREGLERFSDAADLVFLDAEKDLYLSHLEPAVPALREGGCLVADNLISHADDLGPFRAAALSHPRLSGLVVPIGRGELFAVKVRGESRR